MGTLRVDWCVEGPSITGGVTSVEAEIVSDLDLLDRLQQLETELHQLHTRRNLSRLEALLHPEFEEFARSGRAFSRSDILAEFSDVTEYPPVVARNFAIALIGEDAALLTYTSAHAGTSGTLHRHTLRSSLWMRTAHGWQIRFHQGTPTDTL